MGKLREPQRTRPTGKEFIDEPITATLKKADADAAVVEFCWRGRCGESTCTDQVLDIQVAKVGVSREYWRLRGGEVPRRR